MTITIKIETDNAAFEHGGEIERIVLDYAKEANRLGLTRLGDVKLRDYNGNTVGSVEVDED